MTASSFDELSAALGTALSDIEGLEVHDLPGGPYNFPCVVVDLGNVEEYEVTMGRTGTTSVPFDVSVLLPRVDDAIACSEMLGYADPAGDRSVRAALKRSETLSGLAEAVYVRSYERLSITVDGVPAFQGRFRVEVHFQRERA